MDYKKLAPPILRYGIGLVFLVFGIWQIISPNYWAGYLPSYTLSFGVSANLMIFLNGVLDLFIGGGLVLGIYLRFFSALGILRILVIIFSLGWNDVTIRDIGILFALISIFLNGKDDFCLRDFL